MQVTGIELRCYILRAHAPHVVLGVPPTATRVQIKKASAMLVDFLSQYDAIDARDQAGARAHFRAMQSIRRAASAMKQTAKPGRAA